MTKHNTIMQEGGQGAVISAFYNDPFADLNPLVYSSAHLLEGEADQLPSINSFFQSRGTEVGSGGSYGTSCSSDGMSIDEDSPPVYASLVALPAGGGNLDDVSDIVSKANDAFTVEDDRPMDSWVYKHPEEWGRQEILDWIYYWQPNISRDDCDFKGEKFQELDGRTLISLSRDEFCAREPNYGGVYYEMLHKLLEESEFKDVNLLPPDLSVDEMWNDATQTMFESTTYDYDVTSFKQEEEEDCGYESNSSGDFSKLPATVPTTVQSCDESDSNLSSTLESQLPGNRYLGAPAPHCGARNGLDAAARNARMRIPSDASSYAGEDAVTQVPKKRGRRLGQVSNKGNHLWEFIRDLLMRHDTNPSLIRWEDEENGIFRIVNSKRVSELWGQRKNNPGMNYEKLSRAMRHYYKSHILDAVLGKRLVYRFGVNSHGWRRNKTQPQQPPA